MEATAQDFAQLRQTMVDCQLRTFDVTDHSVLGRMAEVPREMFLPVEMVPVAYSDKACTISAGGKSRQLLAPMVLARMLQAAAITPLDNVLCVGGGSGYGAAVVAGLAGRVVALECEAEFTAKASENFGRLGLSNVRAVTGPLGEGNTAGAPFDVIVLEGAIERAPSSLLLMLGAHGRLITIEKKAGEAAGRAVRYDRSGGVTGSQRLFNCNGRVLPGFEAVGGFRF